MKKIIAIVLLVSVILTVGITVYGSKIDKMQIEKAVEKTEEKTITAINNAFKNKDMEKILRKNGLYEDEIKKNMTDYLRCVVKYNMSEDVNTILLNEAEKGKDLDKLLKIYQFLYMANMDFSLIDEMYDYGLRSNFKNAYWLEEAYNNATGSIGGVLNEEKITEYIEKGLDYEDISIANTLCFRGVKTINKILDDRVNKKEWIDIISSIYPEAKINKNNFNDVDPYEVIDYVKNSLAYNENINEMYDKKAKKLSEKAEKQQEKRSEILNRKMLEKNMFYVLDNGIKQLAKSKLQELPEEEIETLMKEGYLIREIERGIKLSKEKGISVKEAIDKDFKGGRKNEKNK